MYLPSSNKMDLEASEEAAKTRLIKLIQLMEQKEAENYDPDHEHRYGFVPYRE